MRSVCSPRSTKTAAGRFQTKPPLGQRTVSACDWGVTVTSPTVTLSPEVVCHLNMSLDRFIKSPLLKFISDTLFPASFHSGGNLALQFAPAGPQSGGFQNVSERWIVIQREQKCKAICVR
jgi:hypothetical protein